MAAKALHGDSLKRADLHLFARIKALTRFLGWELIIGWPTLLLAGWLNESPALKVAAWRDFFLAGVVMAAAFFLHVRLVWLLNTSPTARALYHLPVSGRDICRWARAEVLRRSMRLLPRVMIVAYAWLGFPAPAVHWAQIVACGVLLWFVMLASVVLRHQRLLPRFGLAHVWNFALILWAVLSIYLMWMEKEVSTLGRWPAWMQDVCVPLAWLLPPQWAMHGASHPVPALLTLACLGLGGWHWLRLPRQLGSMFDKLKPPFADGDAAEHASQASASPQPQPSDTMAELKGTLAHEHLALSHGWIESLVLTLLRGRDRMLFPALANIDPGWTRRWTWGVRINLALQLLLLAVVLAYGQTRADEMLEPWSWIIPVTVAMITSFPASNAIPAAMLPYALGQQQMPFFAGLPVRVTDLVRVSTRIALGRMAGWFLLMIPTLVSQCLILGMPSRMLLAMVVCPTVFGLLWTASRPVLVYGRLQQVMKPVRGRYLGHAVVTVAAFILSVGLIISGIASLSLLATFPFLTSNLLWLPLSLLLCAWLCGQGIGALFHTHIRRQTEDWLVQQRTESN